jgi:hypothetical protein
MITNFKIFEGNILRKIKKIFLPSSIVIPVHTQKEYDRIIKYLKENDFHWGGGESEEKNYFHEPQRIINYRLGEEVFRIPDVFCIFIENKKITFGTYSDYLKLAHSSSREIYSFRQMTPDKFMSGMYDTKNYEQERKEKISKWKLQHPEDPYGEEEWEE